MNAPGSSIPKTVIGAFGALRRALDETASPLKRRILRDAVRDALDRNAVDLSLEHGRIVANTWSVTGQIYRGTHFLIERLRHRDLGSEHALKRIVPDHARDPLFRGLLLREAAHHLLIRHPTVLFAQALLRLDDGSPALLMDYRPGVSLAVLLRETPLTLQCIHNLIARLCEALTVIHGAGMTHGDLTPSNILLPKGRLGDAVICDFGLSGAIGEAIDGFDSLGTPGFVAPEAVLSGAPRDARVDIFGLGAVVRACLDALPSDARGTDCAADLLQLVRRLCADDPAARPTSPRAVQALLETTGPRHDEK